MSIDYVEKDIHKNIIVLEMNSVPRFDLFVGVGNPELD